MPKIWIDVLEKPHCGVSGVPFMKRTTGAEATALSIAVRTCCDRRRVWSRWCDIRGWREEAVAEGRRAARAPRNAWGRVSEKDDTKARAAGWAYG